MEKQKKNKIKVINELQINVRVNYKQLRKGSSTSDNMLLNGVLSKLRI
jgi:hypothetical protein